MANVPVKDANGSTKYLSASGDGSIGDPFVQKHDIGSVAGVECLGEESITMNGGAQACTLPANCNSVEISAEGGPVRFTINGTATANSGGYVPQDQLRYLPKQTLTGLSLYGSSPAIAHMNYYQEA